MSMWFKRVGFSPNRGPPPYLTPPHLTSTSATHPYNYPAPSRSPSPSWRQVLRFAWLPSLEQLILTDNAIPEVWTAPNDVVPFFTEGAGAVAGEGGAASAHAAPFSFLSTISLSGTSLTSWASVDNLNTYSTASAAVSER